MRAGQGASTLRTTAQHQPQTPARRPTSPSHRASPARAGANAVNERLQGRTGNCPNRGRSRKQL
eukprot:3124900-Lingulodinium_polyedra.AAC.1